VLQLAAGDEHHGVLSVGPLVGGDDVGRHQLHAPVGRGEVVVEDDGLAGVFGAQTGVGDGAFAQQARPGDAFDGGVHGLAHFFKYKLHAVVPGALRS
jgi:hypothetical protein